ncbi:MAG: hypothetical protein JKY54_04125 [Flavobacteriales bacterium]|nr:hypothetical protein [Flavobacteriales bacterium]
MKLCLLFIFLGFAALPANGQEDPLKFKLYTADGKLVNPKSSKYKVIPTLNRADYAYIGVDPDDTNYHQIVREFRIDGDWFIYDFKTPFSRDNQPRGFTVTIQHGEEEMHLLDPRYIDSISFQPGVFSYLPSERSIVPINDSKNHWRREFTAIYARREPARTPIKTSKLVISTTPGYPVTDAWKPQKKLANTNQFYWYFESYQGVSLFTDVNNRDYRQVPKNIKAKTEALLSNAPDQFTLSDLWFEHPYKNNGKPNWLEEPLFSLYISSDLYFNENFALWRIGDLSGHGYRQNNKTNRVYFSTDNGYSWKKLPSEFPNYCRMVENNGMIMVEGGKSFYTINRNGLVVKAVLTPADDPRKAQLAKVCFINQNQGFIIASIAGKMQVLRTLDGGKSWASLLSCDYIWNLFINDEIIILQLDNYRYFVSYDKGNNWEDVDIGKYVLDKELTGYGYAKLNGKLVYVKLKTNTLVSELKRTDRGLHQKELYKRRAADNTISYKYYSTIPDGMYYASMKDTIYRAKIRFRDGKFIYKDGTMQKTWSQNQ